LHRARPYSYKRGLPVPLRPQSGISIIQNSICSLPPHFPTCHNPRSVVPLDLRPFPRDSLELVQRLELGVLAPENVSTDPPRQPRVALILGKRGHGHRKDVVELLEGSTCRLWGEQENENPSCSGQRLPHIIVRSGRCAVLTKEVRAGVKVECAPGLHRHQHGREGQAKDKRPKVVLLHGKGHADLPVGEWVTLRGIHERDGTHSRRVERGEQVDGYECQRVNVSAAKEGQFFPRSAHLERGREFSQGSRCPQRTSTRPRTA
jgi:hypothetical protein